MRKLSLFLLLVACTADGSDRSSFPYVYKYGPDSHIRSSGDDIESIVRTSKRWSGEFVWLRWKGREYLIRDAGVLAQVRAAFAEMHAFEPQVRAAEERARPLEKKYEAIEERADRLSDRLSDEPELSAAERKDLEERLRIAEREMEAIEPAYKAAEREAERLDQESERLEEIAEEKFERIVIQAIQDGRAERVKG